MKQKIKCLFGFHEEGGIVSDTFKHITIYQCKHCLKLYGVPQKV